MRLLKICLLVLPLFVCMAVFCQNRNNPNLSEQRLKELLRDSTIYPKQEKSYSYNVPAGAKYTEIRAIDTANPPAIIDIVGNINNKKAFKLSDIASSVRYIMLLPPPEHEIRYISSIISDDNHIFVNTYFGLYCYDTQGQFLHAPYINQIIYPEIIPPVAKANSQEIIIHNNPFSSYTAGHIDLLNGKLVFRTSDEFSPGSWLNVFDVKQLDAQMSVFTRPGELKTINPEPDYMRPINRQGGILLKYLWLDDQSIFINSTLTNIAITGDTLCKFNNYDVPTFNPEADRISENINSYRLNGQVTLQKSYNDTVFRVIPPNRLLPAFVMNWGNSKPDINQHVAGSALEGKFVLQNWVETPRFVFIHYTEGRDYPLRRDQGKVKDHWAVYDKTTKTLTHCLLSSPPARVGYTLIPPIFDNDIETAGMPFYPKGVNHRGEMYMTFSKLDVFRYIESGQFPKDKLQTIYDNMPDDSFCLMLVK